MQSSRWPTGMLLAAVLAVCLPLDVGSRKLESVKVEGGYMEVVEEDLCSSSLMRLTCRSLRAFIFVLQAEYLRDSAGACERPGKTHERVGGSYDNRMSRIRKSVTIELSGTYVVDEEDSGPLVDMRKSFNRKCSGHHHCRFTIAKDHPGRLNWPNADLRLKYACIPETAVWRYCNAEMTIKPGDTGYVKSPGYPLYYTGEYSCSWTFKTAPGQRVLLHFHDFDIRSPEPDGNCADLIRVQDSGNTIFESCGTLIGTRVVSDSNRVTLELISSSRLYPARGFLLQYEAVGCPEVTTPTGSYVAANTFETRTFECHPGRYFPDTKVSKKTIRCYQGNWNESIEHLPNCVASSASILKAEEENHRLASFSGDHTGVRIGRGEGADSYNMDSTQNIKGTDAVIDIVIPTILMALLFAGNAFIVYLIFQYRKRKVPLMSEREEMRELSDMPQV